MSTDRIPRAPDRGQATGIHRRTEADLAQAIAEDEARQGRPHTPRERAAFAAGYRDEARQLASWTVR